VVCNWIVSHGPALECGRRKHVHVFMHVTLLISLVLGIKNLVMHNKVISKNWRISRFSWKNQRWICGFYGQFLKTCQKFENHGSMPELGLWFFGGIVITGT
jgi:hypothetical protein